MSLPWQEHVVPLGQLHKISQLLHATPPLTPVSMEAKYADIKQVVEMGFSLHMYLGNIYTAIRLTKQIGYLRKVL